MFKHILKDRDGLLELLLKDKASSFGFSKQKKKKNVYIKGLSSWKVYASAQWGYDENIFTGKNMDYLYHFL